MTITIIITIDNNNNHRKLSIFDLQVEAYLAERVDQLEISDFNFTLDQLQEYASQAPTRYGLAMQIIQFVFYILISIVSCILLFAAIKEKASLTRPWLIVYMFHIVFSVINAISELLHLIIVPQWVLATGIAAVIFDSYSFALVYFYRKELLQDAGSQT